MELWLTKDEHMTPQILSPNHERGFYIVWDPNNWRKDRVSRLAEIFQWQKLTNEKKEFTLHYGDLDTTLNQAQVGP